MRVDAKVPRLLHLPATCWWKRILKLSIFAIPSTPALAYWASAPCHAPSTMVQELDFSCTQLYWWMSRFFQLASCLPWVWLLHPRLSCSYTTKHQALGFLLRSWFTASQVPPESRQSRYLLQTLAVFFLRIWRKSMTSLAALAVRIGDICLLSMHIRIAETRVLCVECDLRSYWHSRRKNMALVSAT